MTNKNKVIPKDLRDIKKVFIDYTGFPEFDSDCKQNDYAYHRFVFMKLCKKLTKYSTATIGVACGDRDHATVIYGLKKFDTLLKDQLFREHYYPIYVDLYKAFKNTKGIKSGLTLAEVGRSLKLEKTRLQKEKKENSRLIKKLSQYKLVISQVNNPIWRKINALDESDFNDWVIRTKAFLSMVESRKKAEKVLVKRTA